MAAVIDTITWNLLVKRLDVPTAGKGVYLISTGKADAHVTRISPRDTVPSPPTTTIAVADRLTEAKAVYPISTGKAGTQTTTISITNIAVATMEAIKRPVTSKANVAIAETVINADNTSVTYMPSEEATGPGWTMTTETHHQPSL